MSRTLPLALVFVGSMAAADSGNETTNETSWVHYGGDAGGQRYSAASQITPANVRRLKPVWSYSTGDMKRRGKAMERTSFEATPILADGRVYACTPFNEVIALDPASGRELWRFDPQIDATANYPNGFVCRGVAYARFTNEADAACGTRIYTNTNDRRLIALDATSGRPCENFGEHGTVSVDAIKPDHRPHSMQITSPPVVVRGVVIVGSSIDDNQRTDEPRGTVRAFDALTGALRWSFDPLRGLDAMHVGAANVWAPMSVDEERGLVFVPTSSPSPDYYGGERIGHAAYANSVVALNADTGAVHWSFQTVHHDLWDYDVASQPTLATVTYRGTTGPAVLQATKQGLLFTLNRDSGEALIPVVERPVPQGGVDGEALSPTQPFPVAPPPLAPSIVRSEDAYGVTWFDRRGCRKQLEAARNEGIFTPPSTQPTIHYPFAGGGTNWGGLAFDATRNIAYLNTSSAIHLITLLPQKDFLAQRKAFPDTEISRQRGTPYAMKREFLLSALGVPCNPPPWGQLHAIDLNDGSIKWQVPLGTTEDLLPLSQHVLGATGTPNLGGPIVTAGGVVFIGAAMDNYLRAFDASTGKELWRGRLPAGGQATPMTYIWRGRQYILIAAGGHSKIDTKRGDTLIAFALPDEER